MGCILGSLASTAACCFGSAACHLCCSCLPSCKNSTSSRLAFASILILGALTCVLMMTPGMKSHLAQIPYFCDATDFQIGTDVVSVCDRLVGYEAVYRVCFALACFYLFFAVIMIRVNSSKDPRSKLQNGFWFFKFAIFIGLCVGAFFIPYHEINGVRFEEVWIWIGMGGAVLFIFIQLVLLIDTVHNWNEQLIRRNEETRNVWWLILDASCVVVFYSITIGGAVILYLYYAKPGCTNHQIFVSVNLVLTVIVSIISELSAVKKKLPYSSVLQSSAVSAYAMYVTWSAMSNNPDRYCNPNLLKHLLYPSSEEANITYSTTAAFNVSEVTGNANVSPVPGADGVTILSVIIWFCCLVFSCMRSSRSATVARLTMRSRAEPVVYSACDGNDSDKEQGQKVWDDEIETTTYSYFFFHLMLLMSSMYIMMTLTNWFRLSPDLTTLNSNTPAMWVKISTAWTAFLIYLWTMIAPLMCPQRF